MSAYSGIVVGEVVLGIPGGRDLVREFLSVARLWPNVSVIEEDKKYLSEKSKSPSRLSTRLLKSNSFIPE